MPDTSNQPAPLYRYVFTDNFGKTFDTIGISEKYDNEGGILSITKPDLTVTTTSNIREYKKTPFSS